MVNYCCVQGCGRNSKSHKHLCYYGFPKEKHRQNSWLNAAKRKDLWEKELASYRICSRHFKLSFIKNKQLCSDAIPTQYLPDSGEDLNEPDVHNKVACNSCSGIIIGFRYKCLTCPDYDLCHKCESMECHSDHYMIRIPKPLNFETSENLVEMWRQIARNKIKDEQSDSSDDDVPITKYVKSCNSGIDLSLDVKNMIREEVKRALMNGKPHQDDNPTKKAKACNNETNTNNIFPEVVFADVNALKGNSTLQHETIVAPIIKQELDFSNEIETD